MHNKIIHPGFRLESMLNEKDLSQRDLASRIDVAHSLINNILKGHRNINVNIAIALESAGFKTASFWLTKQMEFNLYHAQNDKEIIKKKKSIKLWNEMESIIPLSYFKRQDIGIQSSEDIEKIYEIYGVKDFINLTEKINNFNPVYFRKSSKFIENKNNVLAWSLLAEHLLKDDKVQTFSRSNEKSLLEELKSCFYKNKNVIKKTKKILNKYGIKFLTLDRPSQTPVDGKCFMSNKNPAIALSLKYKRLDNFAFSLFHEIGHIYEHLTNPNKIEYKDAEFFVNSSNNEIVEFEADKYASDNLIEPKLFDDFILLNDVFTDDVILDFSKEHKIHPGIVRGRVCYEYNEYYKKRTTISKLNELIVD